MNIRNYFNDMFKEMVHYKFKIGERVKLKHSKDQVIIMDRSKPFDKFGLSVIPGEYYEIGISDSEIGGVKSRLDPAKFTCKKKDLEKLTKTN